MTTQSFSDLYKAAETGANGIPSSSYDVVVEDARGYVNEDKKSLFLDVQVLNGPSQGKVASVKINFPKDGDKPGVFYHFRRKIAGFMDESLQAAFQTADRAPTPETALQTIADALKGKQVTAKIKLVADGAYKGTNELEETKSLSGSATPTEAFQAETATATADNSDGKVVPF